MSDLIKREDVLSKSFCAGLVDAQDNFYGAADIILVDDVLDIPTVDAVEVVHGKWVMVKPRRIGRNATYKCTACNKLRSSYYNDVQEWKYCPCGAKMDLK